MYSSHSYALLACVGVSMLSGCAVSKLIRTMLGDSCAISGIADISTAIHELHGIAG